MLYRAEQRKDGSLRLHPQSMKDDNPQQDAQDMSSALLADIDRYVEDRAESLWPLNNFIHNNPELAFEEHKAHDALTRFMEAEAGWRVIKSAYGLETAWIAVYDSGNPGPVVSFNAEMGIHLFRNATSTKH